MVLDGVRGDGRGQRARSGVASDCVDGVWRARRSAHHTNGSASHGSSPYDNPGGLFRDARFFGEIRSPGRNAATPEDVANPVCVRSFFRYEAEAQAVATNQWGVFRDAGSFDQPRSIERNAATPGNVANTVHVRRSRGNKNAPLCGREILERITSV